MEILTAATQGRYFRLEDKQIVHCWNLTTCRDTDRSQASWDTSDGPPSAWCNAMIFCDPHFDIWTVWTT